MCPTTAPSTGCGSRAAVPFERGVLVRRRNSVPNSAVRCPHHALKPNSVDSRVIQS